MQDIENFNNIYNRYFQVTVYIISLYLIYTGLHNNSFLICLCGVIIAIAHIYKDIVKLEKWPIWCEYSGILIAYILVYMGFEINNFIIIIIGSLKLFEHFRQLTIKDNRYYY